MGSFIQPFEFRSRDLMAKPWGPGAWAAEAEQADAEAEAKAREVAESGSSTVAAAGGAESFPSLREAAAVGKPKKKNKGQTLSISEFATGVYVGPGGRTRGGGAAAAPGSKRLTAEELMMLPTGPRERSADEVDSGRLGGGFRDYGKRVGGGGGGGGFREDGDGQWGSNRRSFGGGFEDDRKPQTRVTDFEPSRADEVDNWASAKKVAPPAPVQSFNRSNRERYDAGGQGSRYDAGGQGSRADEVDNWAVGKKIDLGDHRSGSFGSMNTERWGGRRREGFGFSDRDNDISDRGRPRLVLDPPSRPRNDPLPASSLSDAPEDDAPKPKPKPNPFGNARPREEILAKRGEDWKKVDSEIESRTSSRPTSAHSSRPQSPLSDAAPPKARPKVNPFGDAIPREVLLEQKGKDWRKMDFELEHRGVNRPETEEERKLKEEVNFLKELVKKSAEDEAQVNGLALGELDMGKMQPTMKELMLKEKQLERLTRDLDDKVRFVKRGGDSRPGSAMGRPFEYSERPGSRSGLSDGGRSHDSLERPRSRGGEITSADVWMSSNEGQRGVHVDRERSFQQRNRLNSRERW